MTVWTDAKDDAIISLSSAEFADKARFEKDLPDGLKCKGHISNTHYFLFMRASASRRKQPLDLV